jgi:hypothetical protein
MSPFGLFPCSAPTSLILAISKKIFEISGSRRLFRPFFQLETSNSGRRPARLCQRTASREPSPRPLTTFLGDQPSYSQSSTCASKAIFAQIFQQPDARPTPSIPSETFVSLLLKISVFPFFFITSAFSLV